MSSLAVGATFKIRDPKLTPTLRLVLLAMADGVDHSYTWWGSRDRLCEATGCSDKTIRRSYKTLADLGYLKSGPMPESVLGEIKNNQIKAALAQRTAYTLTYVDTHVQQDIDDGHDDHPTSGTVVTQSTDGGQMGLSDGGHCDPQNYKQYKTKNYNLEQSWQRFRETYPKRQGAQRWPTAKKCFDKLCSAGEDPNQIIMAAENYERAMRTNLKRETVQQAATFLGRDQTWREYLEDYIVEDSTQDRIQDAVNRLKAKEQRDATHQIEYDH